MYGRLSERVKLKGPASGNKHFLDYKRYFRNYILNKFVHFHRLKVYLIVKFISHLFPKCINFIRSL